MPLPRGNRGRDRRHLQRAREHAALTDRRRGELGVGPSASGYEPPYDANGSDHFTLKPYSAAAFGERVARELIGEPDERVVAGDLERLARGRSRPTPRPRSCVNFSPSTVSVGGHGAGSRAGAAGGEQRRRRDHLERRAGRVRAVERAVEPVVGLRHDRPDLAGRRRRSRRARRCRVDAGERGVGRLLHVRVDRDVDRLRGCGPGTSSPCARASLPTAITTVPRRAARRARVSNACCRPPSPTRSPTRYGGPSCFRRSAVISPTVPISCAPSTSGAGEHALARAGRTRR